MTVYQSVRKRDWENTFTSWAQPPEKTEQERCERAVNAIKKAVAASDQLSRRSIRTFAQGSYANRTNVRQQSDVDVCILCSNTFYFDGPNGLTLADIGCEPATYAYDQYKNEVETALVSYFGRDQVKRGNKAFDIHENTYRVDADAVACFDYRLYYFDTSGKLLYHPGTALITDREQRRITNFPEQQYDNGVAKNTATGSRFKALVRIIKTLRNEMDDVGVVDAGPMASFLLESLVWNWPNEMFNQSSYISLVTGFLAFIWDGTKTDEGCRRWKEENGIKVLFAPHNEWTRQQVHNFALAAYSYISEQ